MLIRITPSISQTVYWMAIKEQFGTPMAHEKREILRIPTHLTKRKLEK